jgi:branched-subunit amino acid transport protein
LPRSLVPTWLHVISIASLGLGALCAIVIAADVARHPQHMWIMEVVWPVTALFGTVWIIWQYFSYGRLAAHEAVEKAKRRNQDPPNKRLTPFPVMVANGSLHCGSGCTLGDIVAEWLAFAFPAVAIAFGWQIIFQEKIFAVWILDYLFAYAFGILFQYFTIAPMRGLSIREGLIAAVKADTISITAWQVGMYGFMAFAHFYVFRHVLGTKLEVNSFEFWFMMQIAMLFGFVTSYPANWWLLRSGLKESM